MAIHREVLEKLAATLPLVAAGKYQYRPFCHPMMIESKLWPGLFEDLSEDWALCERWRNVGGECWVDAGPILFHKGDHIFSIDDCFRGRDDGSVVDPATLPPLDYIVLSSGHSGTGYMARLLSSAGIPCGHESVFGINVESRPELRADSSLFAVAHLDHPIAAGAKLIHLVRNPLKVIRSWHYAGFGWTGASKDPAWSRRILRQFGLQLPMTRDMEGLAWQWVRWNQLIDKVAPDAQLVRVEDRSDILQQLKLKASTPWDDPAYNAKPGATNAPEVTLDQLGDAAPAVKAMAERYGYTL
jgi:hypothetical protein